MTKQQELFDAFVECLFDILKNGGMKVIHEDGTEGRIPLGAPELGVIRQFLKDYPVVMSVSREQFINDYGDLPFFQEPRTPEKRDKRNGVTRTH